MLTMPSLTVPTPRTPVQYDDSVPWIVEPESVPFGTPAPYKRGDDVEVLVTPPGGPRDGFWLWGNVLECEQRPPSGGFGAAKRFRCSILIGHSAHWAWINDRIYCNADGRGEEIRPIYPVIL